MNRVVLPILAILLLGVWLQPMLTPAGEGHMRDVAEFALAAPSTQPTLDLPRDDTPADAPIVQYRGTEGFWRIGLDANGVWWFIAPDGRREFMNTVTTVQPYQHARDKFGPEFVSRDYNGQDTDKGDFDAWAAATLVRIQDTGFKGLGAWCNPVFHKYEVPITRDLNIAAWQKTVLRNFYHPDWAATAEVAVKTQVEHLRDNKHLVGYFSDNELDWGDSGAGPYLFFDYLSPNDPNRQEVVKVIRSVWKDIDGFNRDWQTDIKDWSEIDQWKTLPHNMNAAYGRLFTAWLSHFAEDYFELTSNLIRKYDPNHLVLGVRFKSYGPKEVVRASRNHTDAQSLNYYVSDGRLDLDLFKMMHEESGQPIIITEYSFHSLDGRSGNRNTVGFMAQVLDQQARADGYRLMTTRLAKVPYIIGADWFQWMDEPPSGRSSDGEDVNFGIVDIDDRPYEMLVESIRKTTPLLNPIHAASPAADPTDVWRESFANKPVMQVPYLAQPITLNGELSDWPARAKLHSVRHSNTIGLERSQIPMPNVYLGYSEAGFYIGFEIFDNDIQGAPAQGWWWTRDNAEFWLSTKPVSAELYAYDVNCHQFFFTPKEFPDDGISGTFGQWHRPGDALKNGNLIPHPLAKTAVRILHDRYVVEVFIPGEALVGWDPVNQPEMAFNMHVRNFQHATDYFWSAPKELQTQLRPNTWGVLKLDPPTNPDTNLAQAAASE